MSKKRKLEKKNDEQIAIDILICVLSCGGREIPSELQNSLSKDITTKVKAYFKSTEIQATLAEIAKEESPPLTANEIAEWDNVFEYHQVNANNWYNRNGDHVKKAVKVMDFKNNPLGYLATELLCTPSFNPDGFLILSTFDYGLMLSLAMVDRKMAEFLNLLDSKTRNGILQEVAKYSSVRSST